jgi:hypothetical protein
MSIAETVFIVSSVINVLLLVLVFIMYTNLLSMKTYITQLHTGTSTILNKIFIMDQTVNRLAVGFTEFINTTEALVDRIDGDGVGNTLYRTGDGKYSAKSLEELIEKISRTGSETEYFSDDELNKLRKMFETEDSDNFEDEE